MQKVFTYQLGLLLSILLTFAAFYLVHMHLQSGHVWPSHQQAAVALLVLALLQFVGQTVLFLHLGQDPKQRYFVALFIFALIVVAIIVGGTTWIMYHLSDGHGGARELYTGGTVTPQAQND